MRVKSARRDIISTEKAREATVKSVATMKWGVTLMRYGRPIIPARSCAFSTQDDVSDDELEPMEAVSDVSDSEDVERGLALGLGSASDILRVGGDMSPTMEVILTNLGDGPEFSDYHFFPT